MPPTPEEGKTHPNPCQSDSGVKFLNAFKFRSRFDPEFLHSVDCVVVDVTGTSVKSVSVHTILEMLDWKGPPRVTSSLTTCLREDQSYASHPGKICNLNSSYNDREP